MAKLLTIRELAELCGLSTRTIFRLVDSGKVPQPIRLGKAIRWNSEEVEKWIASGCQASNSKEAAQ